MRKRQKKDWTTASGTKLYPSVYTPDPGWRIDKVIGSVISSHSYTDSNHTEDRFPLGSGGPVKQLVYVGDTKGKEAGTRTKVTVYYNPVRLVLVQDKNCVSESTVAKMQAKGKISPTALKRLAPALTIQRATIKKSYKITTEQYDES